MRNIQFKLNKKCICCNKKLVEVIKLPNFPVTEFYIKSTDNINKKYLVNQAYLYCDRCDHMTISKTLDPKFIYSNYTTLSSNSRGAYECLKNFYTFFKKDKINTLNSSIIDIGGNDSYFLKLFKAKNKINIDPNAYDKDKKIKIYKTFFDKINFAKFKSKNKNIFFSSHTLEHLAKPEELIKNISISMKDSDRLYLQFPSLERLIIKKRFDQLCHQHLHFFSLNSINKLLNKNFLYVKRYEYDDTHFGTLRILATKIEDKNFKRNIKLKMSKKLITQNFSLFYQKCRKFNQKKLNKIVNGQGFGAGILTPVLAYFYPNLKKLKYIFDDNQTKFKKKFITMSPVIENPKKIIKNSPIVITSTSTNLAPKDIQRRLNKLGCKKIIMPTTALY